LVVILLSDIVEWHLVLGERKLDAYNTVTQHIHSDPSILDATGVYHSEFEPVLVTLPGGGRTLPECFACPVDGGIVKLPFGKVCEDSEVR
jgi:hypothetical protein